MVSLRSTPYSCKYFVHPDELYGLFSLQMLDYNVPGGMVETHPKILQDFVVLRLYDELIDAKFFLLFAGKLNRGLSVIESYKLLKQGEELSDDEVFLASALGWCIEWVLLLVSSYLWFIISLYAHCSQSSSS